MDAYSTKQLLDLSLPWCAWTHVAAQFVRLIEYLATSPIGPLVHCDWKATQFVRAMSDVLRWSQVCRQQVVRKSDLRVVLVDVDSLQAYKVNRSYLDRESCVGKHSDYCSATKGECFQELARKVSVPDAQCDHTTGWCVGYDARSMLWAFGRDVLRDIAKAKFVAEHVEISRAYEDMLATLIRETTRDDRQLRWSVDRVLRSLEALLDQYNGWNCISIWMNRIE
jgi:hypothetical protein